MPNVKKEGEGGFKGILTNVKKNCKIVTARHPYLRPLHSIPIVKLTGKLDWLMTCKERPRRPWLLVKAIQNNITSSELVRSLRVTVVTSLRQ